MEFKLHNVWVWMFLFVPGALSNLLYGDSHFDYKIYGVESNLRQNEDPSFGCPTEKIKCNKKALYREFDGTCNNLKNPYWGSANIKYERYLPPQYDNDLRFCSNSGRLPTARQIVAALNSLPFADSSIVSVLNMQWGQFISHDINLTPRFTGVKCCVDCSENSAQDSKCLAVDVRNDPFFVQFGVDCLENTRSVPAGSACGNVREQVNAITAYIDASLMYGISKEAADELRTFSKGQMKVRNGEEDLNGGTCPPEAVCPFKFLPTVLIDGEENIIAGDAPRLIQHPALTAVHNLLLRTHNDIAERLAADHTEYNDEEVYQVTRQLVIAIIQHITYNEYLPSILPTSALNEFELPSLPPGSGYSKGYKNFIDSSLRNSFSAAAFRMGHSQVPDIFCLSSGKGFLLSEAYLNNTFTFNPGTQPSDILNGISPQRSNEVDQNLVESLANKLFARGPEYTNGSDLFSRNINRGRDHGLPSYSEFRSYCNLPSIENFDDLEAVMKEGVAQTFRNLYSSVNQIDLYPALISEKPESDGVVGPTLSCILSDQFWRIKYGDRFYYESHKHPNPFNLDQLDAIRRTCLSALLCRYTNTRVVPKFVLKVPGLENPFINCANVVAETVLDKLEDLF